MTRQGIARAMGGASLLGDRLVRLVYIDEAGISNPKHEPFAVVVGVIIDADKKLVAIERHLDRLVNRHIPEKDRASFVFHAKELFNGGGPVFKRESKDAPNPKWPLHKRLAVADDLAAIPKKFRVDLALGWMDRSTFVDEFDLPRDMPPPALALAAHAFAFLTCSMRIEQWMRLHASNEVCLLVVEDNDRARKVIRETQRHYQDPTLTFDWAGNEKIYFPFRKIKEDPLFQQKRSSSALQIADFCAYVFKKFLMGDSRYDRFFDPMRHQIAVPVDAQSVGRRAQKPRRSRQRQAAGRSP